MADLSSFPITQRWPAGHPDRIQLYSYPTPNGQKVAIALEEMELPYEAHLVTLKEEDVKSPEFTSLNPNGKIPAIIDPEGPEGPMGLFESGAILLYLAAKCGRFGGQTALERHRIQQWLMFQMGGVGPMFGQLGFFYAYGGKDMEDPLARNRYIGEAKRLLGVIDTVLTGRDWIAGDYSIADMAIGPWLAAIGASYHAEEAVGFDTFARVRDYLERFKARPAVERGWNVPPAP